MTFNEAASRFDTSIKKLFDDLIQEHHVEIGNLLGQLSTLREEEHRLNGIRVQICNALFISDKSTWTNIRDEITKEQLIGGSIRPQPIPSSSINELIDATRSLEEKIKLFARTILEEDHE